MVFSQDIHFCMGYTYIHTAVLSIKFKGVLLAWGTDVYFAKSGVKKIKQENCEFFCKNNINNNNNINCS